MKDALAPFGVREVDPMPEGSNGTPWVASTPTRTVQAKLPNAATPLSSTTDLDKEKKEEKPPAESEILQKLASMKEKLKAKGFVDEEVMNSLQEAEQIVSGPAPSQKLTHKVVTQLQKAEKNKESLKGQIQDLDKKWQEWHSYMQKKHQEQRGLFMDKRKALLDRYAETRGKIAELKEEIKSVAASMVVPEEEEVTFLSFTAQDAFVEDKIDLTAMSDEDPQAPEEIEAAAGTRRSASRSRTPPHK